MSRRSSALSTVEGLVDRKINDEYVDVKKVADNIDSVINTSDNMNSVLTVADQALAARDSAAAALASENAAKASELVTISNEAATSADAAQTALDVITTNKNVETTNTNVETTNDNVAITNSDVVATNADVVTTAANRVQTAIDVETTNANVVTSTAKADEALASANSALSSASSALDSASSAATYASNASVSESNAASSESNAQTSADNASTSETNAAVSEANASASELAAATSESIVSVYKDAIEDIYDNFDDRYLGGFNEDPTLDNDGQALLVGAIYYNTVDKETRFYNGTTWDRPEFSSSQSAIASSISAEEAENWANYPVDLLVPQGDLADDYSALHHATKASESATAASVSETNAAISEANASSSEISSANSSHLASASASQAAASVSLVATSASQAALSEANALQSAQNSAVSEANALQSEQNAADSETNAYNSEQIAITKSDESLSSAASALASASSAASSASDALTSETNASTSETNTYASEQVAIAKASEALSSANSALSSASSAASSASDSSISEYNASISATESAASATSAATSAANAATSATLAEASEDKALISENAASTSAAAASASETAAALSETNAAVSETNSANSATASANSASAAASSESSANTNATAASNSASAAALSAANAATSETNAANSASAASVSETNAASSESTAQAIIDELHGTYLGVQSTDPSVDLNGNPLDGGEWYYNDSSSVTRIYVSGTGWANGAVDTTSFILANSDAALDSLQLNGGTGDQGTFSWNVDEETVDVVLNGSVLQLGQEIHVHARNNTASEITNGTPVYATGTLGASGRITVAPYIADGTVDVKFYLGISTEDIPAGEDGKIAQFGKIRHINTSVYSDGDVLYVSPTVAGELTNTEPTGADISLPVAFVIHSGSNGTLFTRTNNLNENAFATYAQGLLADSALQSGDNVSALTNDASYATTSYVDQAEADAISTAAADATTKADAALAGANTYTDTAVSNLVDTAPGTLDTLNELAAALGDDPNFATTVTDSIATKLDANANAVSASKLETSRSISLSGDVSGTVSFDGTANVDITATVADDSHNHIIANVDGLQTALDAKLPSSSYTASDVLTKLKTVDGSGSLLDADLLDGQQGSYYLDGNNFINLPEGYSGWTVSDGTNSEKIADNHTLTITGSGASSTSYDAATNTLTITSTDTNTNTVYTHPTHPGDDFAIDTGPLTGATVVSDIDINVTTDSLGHVTDANGVVSTRNLTLGDLGYTGATNANYFTYTHPSHPGDDINLDTGALSGATVISDLDFNVTTDTQGHVTDANATYSTRTLTLGDLGFTGDSNANNFTYSHPSTHPATMITTTDEFAYSNSSNVQDVLDDLDQAIANVNAKDPVITITGDVTGSGTMTNLGNVSITATIADDSHNHTIANVDGLQTALNGKLSTTGKAADADKLDGLNSTQFLRSDTSDTTTGTLKIVNAQEYDNLANVAPSNAGQIRIDSGNNGMSIGLDDDTNSRTGWIQVGHDSNTYPSNSIQGTLRLNPHGGSVTINNNTVWHSGNDGSGSGLDADTVDGLHASSFLRRHFGNVTVPDTTNYQQVCKINGSELGSIVKVTLVGTTGNVVVNISAEILVNHSGDISIKSYSGNYTQLYLQVVSDANDDFDIRLRGTGSINNTTLRMEVHTLNNESVTFTTTSTYSTTTLTHLTKAGGVHITSTGGSGAELYLDGDRAFHDGYHPNADKWTTARTLSLTGDVTGSTSWDGSGNASITTTVANDSHTHSNYASNSATSSQTLGAGILNFTEGSDKINADPRWNSDGTGATAGNLHLWATNGSGATYGQAGIALYNAADYQYLLSRSDNGLRHKNKNGYIDIGPLNSSYAHIYTDRPEFYFNKNIKVNGSQVWHSGNDGSGSGLDADKLDGQHASAFAAASHTHSYLPLSGGTVTGNLTVNGDVITDEIRARTGQDLTITCGEVSSVLTDATNNDEVIRLAGEGGVKVYASSDNLTSGLNRVTTLIDTSGNMSLSGNLYTPGNIYHVGDTNTYIGFHAADQWRVVTGGAERLEVNNTNVTISNTLVESSDARLKENVRPIEDALSKVTSLQGVHYNKIETPELEEIGFIAQEVEEVVPEIVTTDDTEEGMKAVSYARTVALLVEAIKEQQKQIDDLKSELEQIKSL
jgi:hypothetical protein